MPATKSPGSPLRVTRLGLPLIGIVATVLVWEIFASLLGPFRLPSLLGSVVPQLFPLLNESDLLAFQGAGSHGLLPHLLYTVVFTLIGTTFGVLLGVLVALLMWRYRLIQTALTVPIEILRTVPPLAVVPFLLVWLGPTLASQIALLLFYSFVTAVTGSLNSISNLDPVHTNYARTMGASTTRIGATVILPSLIPSMVGTIRVCLGVAWGIQVVAEMLAGTTGMGQVFARVAPFQALDVILVGLLWLAAVAFVLDRLLLRIAAWATRWR